MRPTSGFVSDHSLGLRLFETEQDDFGEIISELWKSESIFDSRHAGEHARRTPRGTDIPGRV